MMLIGRLMRGDGAGGEIVVCVFVCLYVFGCVSLFIQNKGTDDSSSATPNVTFTHLIIKPHTLKQKESNTPPPALTRP